MRILPKDGEKAIRALRRRNPLLDAWLDALDRLDGPYCRIVTSRNIIPKRRPLSPSVERHWPGRPSPHLAFVHRQSL